MSEKAKNKIIVLEPATKSVTELLALVQEKNLAEIVKVKTAEEAITTIIPALPCLFLSSLIESNEVPAGMQLLKRLEQSIKHHGLKVYMVTGIKNRQLSDLFTQKMGVTDYIIDPVPVRTMYFKINLAIKAVENFRKQQEIKRAAQEQIVIKKFEGKKSADPAVDVAAKGKPALQMAEDTFLFKNGGAKKIGKKFVVEVEGPEPSTGEWQQHEDKGEAKSAWRWVPNEEKEAQASGKAPPDGWVHEGDKPAFNEETGKWSLSSDTPTLALKKDGKVVAEKVGLDEKGELVIADDSPAAEANLVKNREKASVEIKQREERQKVLTEKKKAAEKSADAKDSVLASLAESEPGLVVPSIVNSVEETDKGSKVKKPAKNEKSAALQSLMNSIQADESDEPTDFNNKLDGKKEELRSVVDKREDVQIKAGNAAEHDEQPVAPAPAKKSSPLDFLKKKKELLKQAALANEVNQIAADAPLKGANALKESEEEPGVSAGVLNRKQGKKGKPSAIDRLAQLRAELETSTPEEEPSDEVSSGEASSANADTDRSPRASSAVKAEKKGTHNLKLKPGDKPEDRGSPKLKLQEKKKKTLESLKDTMLKPLPEVMSPEEEQELREELGLEGRPEIKVKELARKKRQAEVDRVKGLLAEIDEEMEKAGEAISANEALDAEDHAKKVRKGDLASEKLKGIRSATDSLDSDEPEDESEDLLKRKKFDDEQNSKRGALSDESLYMPEADLQPLGSAWESSQSHFVYLDAKVRYKGFEKLEDILPLWIFRGDQVPELLDKTKQWRFRGSLPVKAKTSAELPSDVRDYLIAIRDQIKTNSEQKEPEEADAPADVQLKKKGKDKKASAGSALDRLKAQLAGEEESAEENADELSSDEPEEEKSESFSAKGKFKAGGELTMPGEELDGLKARRGKSRSESAVEEEQTDNEEAIEEEGSALAKNGKLAKKGPKKGAAAAGLDALSRMREKLKSAQTEAEPEEEPVREEAFTAAEPEIEAEETGFSDDESADSKMAKLRAKLEAESSDEPEGLLEKKKKGEKSSEGAMAEEEELSTENAAERPGSPESKSPEKKKSSSLESLREKLGLNEPEDGEISTQEEFVAESEEPAGFDAPGSTAEEKIPALEPPVIGAANSEAVKKFMERRKNKKAKTAAAKSSADPAAKSVAVYLGIFVSISDSLAQETEAGVALPRVLKAFEDSFGDCTALCTGIPDGEGDAEVRFCAPSSPEALTRVKLNSGIFEPITTGDGGPDDLLGYLCLRAAGGRSVFSDAERSTIKQVARRIWPIMKRDSLDTDPETESKAA